MAVTIKNVRAGNKFKLPNGVFVRKGQSVTVPDFVLSKAAVRAEINRGRLMLVTETTAAPEPEPTPPPVPAPEPVAEPDSTPKRRMRRKKAED